jgi:hypothetical protein
MDREEATQNMIEYMQQTQQMPLPIEQQRQLNRIIGQQVQTPPRPRGQAEWSLERQQTIERMFQVGMPIPEPTDIQYAIDDLVYKLNEARAKLELFGAWLDGEEPVGEG